MTSTILPSLFHGFVGSVLSLALYYIYWELTVGAPRRALIKKHGCKPIKSTAELNGFPHNFFGAKILLQNMTAVKSGFFLENVRQRFRRNGNTFHTKVLFTEMWSTVEPENLKTMLAVKFRDWELSERRKTAFVPLLGHGIFTSDGAAWQHSREMLRPNFARNQVADLATFENHVKQLIKAVPRDGSTVNLQDLFFKLTMDSATEFLFGESTDCLELEKTSQNDTRFAEAFSRSQERAGENFRSGKLIQWLNKHEFKRDSDYVQKYVDQFVEKGLEYRKSLDLSKEPPEVKEGERYVFLYELVKRIADPVHIRSELLNILMAGRDTTASLLSDVWFILARRSDIWAKLRAEVDELGGAKPTYQQIKDMKYLKMVLNECKLSSHENCSSLADFHLHSIASLSSCPRKCTRSRRRYSPSPRRRRRRKVPTPRSQRPNSAMVCIRHASSQGLLR